MAISFAFSCAGDVALTRGARGRRNGHFGINPIPGRAEISLRAPRVRREARDRDERACVRMGERHERADDDEEKATFVRRRSAAKGAQKASMDDV